MSGIILQGKVGPLGLFNLVQMLCSAQTTGALRISESGLTFTILLDKGYIVSASAPEQERLGEKLVRRGRITREELQRALRVQETARARGTDLPLGHILIHRNLVSEKVLEDCLFDQIVETICLSLELPNPYFSFASLDVVYPAKFRGFVSFQLALLEAFRVADETRARDEAARQEGATRAALSCVAEEGGNEAGNDTGELPRLMSA